MLKRVEARIWSKKHIPYYYHELRLLPRVGLLQYHLIVRSMENRHDTGEVYTVEIPGYDTFFYYALHTNEIVGYVLFPCLSDVDVSGSVAWTGMLVPMDYV